MMLSNLVKRYIAGFVATVLVISSFFSVITLLASANTQENQFENPLIGEGSYDFSNSSEYSVTNDTDSKYYGYLGSTALSGGVSVSDGVLKLNSGSSSGRTVQTWVINKNGQPFELVPGVEYIVTFDIKQTAVPSGNSTTYISLSNGVCINDTSWYDSLGATASVMPESSGVEYEYSKGNKQNTNLTTYPNNAINATYADNHICYVKNGRYLVSADGERVETKFVAYDITSNGENAENRNYLALTFGLYAGQQIEIDNINITYDYSKFTKVTFVNGDVKNTTIMKVNEEVKALDNNGNYTFIGWYNEKGQKVTTVPSDAEDGSVVLTAKWNNPFEQPVTLDAENEYALEYDFDTSNGDSYLTSEAYIGYKSAKNISGNNGSLTVSSESDSSQLWLLNKNGVPFLLENGITYNISFEVTYTGTQAPEILLSNGIKKADSEWNGCAPVNTTAVELTNGQQTYSKSFTATDITNNGEQKDKRNYLAFVFGLKAGQTVEVKSIKITYDYTKHTLVTYQYDPADTLDTETVLANVGTDLKVFDYINDRKFIEWRYNGSKVTKVPATSTGKALLVAELEPDPLEGLTKYDFSKPHQYELDNTNGKFISTYYGGMGAAVRPEIESGIEVSDGKLKLTSGMKNSANYPNQRTVKTWILNKDGVPFEFTPGETYSISFTVKQNGAPASASTIHSYIALGNGAYFNDNSWADNLGTSAAIMSDSKDKTYSYKAGAYWQWPDTAQNESYPNNAIKAGSQNKLIYSSTAEGIKEQEVSITFTAYDVASQGANYKNYFALIYSLSGNQEIEIDNLTIHESDKNTIVTYDYRDGTTKTQYSKIGDTITVPDSTNIPLGKKQEGWRDASGKVYTTVPKGVNGKITLFPNLVRTLGLGNVDDPLKKTFDFEFDDEIETSNTSDTILTGIYNGGISAALQKVIYNDIAVEDGALKIGSGIPADAEAGTAHNIQTWIINDNGKPIELKPGKTYSVNFKVRQTSAPLYVTSSYISLSNGVCYKDNSWKNSLGASASVMPAKEGTVYDYQAGAYWRWPSASPTPLSYPNNAVEANNSNKLLFDNTLAGLKNSTISYTFTAYDITNGGTKSGYKNYLALTVALRQGQEIEIDDFIIYETDSYQLVSYDLGGYGEMDSFFATKGDVIKLTNLPDNDDAQFQGWFTDPEFKNPVKNNIFTVGDTNVTFYARFEKLSIIEDFENYAGKTYRYEGETSRNPWFGYYSFLSEKYAKSGKTSLNVNVLGTERNQTWALLTCDGKDFKVSEGQTYLFSFDYYVENAEGDLEMFPHVSGSGGIWEVGTVDGKTGGIYREMTEYTITIPRSDEGKGWKRVSFEFKPTLKYSGYNTLYFKFNNLTVGTSIYFDNFKAELMTDKNTMLSIYPNNGENPTAYLGVPGQKFTLPTVKSKYMTFKGWYTDVTLTKPYKGNRTFGEKSLSLYAKWQYKKGVEIKEGFENYKGTFSSTDFSIVTEDPASGKKCLKYAFEPRNDKTDYISLFIGNDAVPISNGQRFAMSFKYKILEEELDNTNLPIGFSTANRGQLKIEQYENWAYWTYNYIPGEWHLFNDILTAEKLKSGDNILKFFIGSLGQFKGTVYIDDIKLVPLQKDDVVLTLYTDQLSTNLPTHIIGKPGKEFKYPTSATRTKGNWFLGGWCTDRYLKDLITNETGAFLAGEDLKIWARWCKKKIYEGFESDYVEKVGDSGWKSIGLDYEIYNSSVKGFNKSNVKAGKNSLHRIGDNHMWKNTQLLINDNHLAVGRKYKLTFKVKMDESLHTDGSIRIISNIVWQTGYDTSGEYLNVVNIADLTDKKWHTVTFNFVALSEYLTISTPGYCSLYIDDVSIELLSDKAQISDSVYCANEYQPLLRDKDGNILEEGKLKLNLHDDTLKPHLNTSASEGNQTIMITVIVIAAVLLLGGAFVGTYFILKAKKAKKLSKEVEK